MLRMSGALTGKLWPREPSARYDGYGCQVFMLEKLKRFIRYWYLRLVRIQASPHNIALGLAAGVFVGLLPVLPFQTVIAIALAFVVRGSKIAAALGTWVSNPLNWVPVYMMFYYVGRAVVPFDVPPFNPSQLEMAEMIEMGWKFFTVMMVGGLVVATPSAVFSYFIALKGVQAYRTRRQARLSRDPAAPNVAAGADAPKDPGE
ncbi:MAG: DUF2062 domain-containing protein [Deltaproteobacteria bacterium]|nr:DUF2062 domain-containing protein [Deltaproteobacteria bacterium]